MDGLRTRREPARGAGCGSGAQGDLPARGTSDRSGADAGLALTALTTRGGPLAVVGLLDLAVRLGHLGLRGLTLRGSAIGSTGPRRVEDSSDRAGRRKHVGRPGLRAPALALAGLLALAGTLTAQEEPAAGSDEETGAGEVVAEEATPEPPPADEAAAEPLEAAPGDEHAVQDPPADPPAETQDTAAALEPDNGPARVELDASQRTSRASAAAKAFSAKIRTAFALEVEIQDFENSTLGLKDPETLNGYPLVRWHRIQEDLKFQQVASQVSLAPLDLPTPAAAKHLSSKMQMTLFDFAKAYENSRRTHSLDPWMKLGRAFLKHADWGQRDRAVRLRDHVIRREIEYTRLGKIAVDVVNGDMGEAQAYREIRKALKELAPQVEEERPEMTVLVLEDDNARVTAQTSVAAMLMAEIERDPPPRPLEEMQEEVAALSDELIELASLADLIALYDDLSGRLENADEDFERVHERIDWITGDPNFDPAEVSDLRTRSREIVDVKISINSHRNQISLEWYSTPVDPETYELLIDGYEELARRMMLDLGAPGVLYMTQLDLLVEERALGFPSHWSHWEHLEGHQDLLANLEAAWPEADPLEGLAPPSAKGQQLLKQAQAAAAAAAARSKGGPPKALAKKPKKKPKKKGGAKKKPR